MTTINTNKTKFLYLRDANNQNRVATIARKRSGENEMELSFSMNAAGNSTDRFDKTLGRKIASGRLESGSKITTVIRTGETPLTATVRSLTENKEMVPHSLRRMAKEWLEARRDNEQGNNT